MADFDFSTLVTDRSPADLELLRDLLSTPMSDWTAEQLAAFNLAASKGAYNYTDLNRVIAAMDDLNERLTAAGYETGYQRVQVPHQNGESRLPQGYTELKYIHKSGNAYINTGFVPAWDSGIEMTIAIHQVSDYSAPFGARSSSSVTDAYSNLFFIAPAGQPRSDYYGDSIGFQASIPFGQVLTISQRSNVVSVGTQTETHQTSTRSSAYPWFLLDVNTAGEPRRSGEFDLYACKIYDGETLVRDYIPCKNQSGKAGLYDTIGGIFYSSATGTEFEAGPETEPPAHNPDPELDPYTWYDSDVPTVSLMDEYLSNVAALRAVLDLPETTPEVPADMDRLTQAEANAIEEILDIINTYLVALQSILRRCGAVVCGGPELYFVN